MTKTFIRMAAAVLLAGLAANALDAAAQRRPVPDVPLVSLDGAIVQAASLARADHWLLVYVEPNCGSCSAVLSAMSREDHPGLAERVTVIVGRATIEQARAVAAASTELPDARWLVDADGHAGQALGVRSAPMVWGIRAGTIEWSFTGALRRSAEMTSLLVSWLRQG